MRETYKLEIKDKHLEVQLNNLADQASGCCLIKQGDTSILSTVQFGEEKPEMGFFPLTCEYEERFYAAGKILGSRFIRREGRPSTNAVLAARMIDRAVRPLFPEELKKEVQVIATCLSWDHQNDPAVLGLNGASLSLGLSAIPFAGPVAAVRVGKEEGSFVLNPDYEQRQKGGFDIVFAGIETKQGILINMIEACFEEAKEEEVLKALEFAKEPLKKIIDFQKDIISKRGKEKLTIEKRELDKKKEKQIKGFVSPRLEKALFQKDRKKSKQDMKELEQELLDSLEGFEEEELTIAKDIFYREKERILEENVLEKEKRPDNRSLDEIREINCEVGVLPRTHGSAIFTRGETRILSILTLGPPGDQQLLEEMEFSGKKRFLHHYNFPPYSVGEVRRLGSPGRREIGHGMLAEKALLPLIPSLDDFPYTIRIVSEALSSNGSTSMASVSAGCLALMDAGVPIKKPVAGIAIGLIKKSEKEYKLLTDIQGPEDSAGDMDFKVAGTETGITAVQLDVKVDGISKEVMEQVLSRAKNARMQIIAEMKKVILEPRKKLSPYAPRIYTLAVNPDKIGLIIGTGGKTINEIIEECGVEIDIEDSGKIFVSSLDEASAQKAIAKIKSIAKEYKIGEVYNGKVVRITDFGAFVELSSNQDGLVHVSELAPFRVSKVEDVVQVGDKIPVQIINIDEQGRINLSAKRAGFKPQEPKKHHFYGRKGK